MSGVDITPEREGRGRRPLKEYGNRVKTLTSQMDGEADKILQCMNKKKPVPNKNDETAKMKQQINSLTMKLEKNEQKTAAKIGELNTALEKTVETQIAKYQAAIQAKIHQLEKKTEAQNRDVRDKIQQSTAAVQESAMRAVATHVGKSHRVLETKMDDVKHEMKEEYLKQELQSCQKLSNIEQMMLSMLDNQKRQMLEASSQRFLSTSTLDTVGTGDTGFCDAIPETQEDSDFETQDTDGQDTGEDDAIPSYIKDIGLKMETIALRRVKHLARHLGIDHTCLLDMRDELDHRKDFQNLFWDVIAAWCQKCKRERKKITLDEFLQAVDAAGIQRKVKAMPSIDRHIIEKNVPMLVDRLIVHVLVVKLRGSGLLCPDDVNYILDSSQQIERVTRLVDLLSILGDQALDSFIKALNESGQTHIANAIIRSSPTRFAQVTTGHTQPKTIDMNPINRRQARNAWEMMLQSKGSVRESHV